MKPRALNTTSFAQKKNINQSLIRFAVNTIKLPGHSKPIELSDIMYLRGEDNYTWIHLRSGKQLLASQTLLYFALQLTSFVRIHKRFMVNPDFVTNAHRTGYYTAVVTISNQTELPIARRSISAVLVLLRERFTTPVAEVVS